MLQCSVQLLSWLLDDISKETVAEGPCTLVWDKFSLLGQYSCQAHLSCLNHCVPVVDMLMGVAENSCKKVGEREGEGKGEKRGEGRWRAEGRRERGGGKERGEGRRRMGRGML